MKTFYKCYILFYFSFFSSYFSQELLRDDFQFKSNYWYWRADGNQEIPSVTNGLLKLELLNADTAIYCNTEIYNPSEPYSVGTQVKIRLKCSPQHIGSRGWGFWDGDLDLYSMLFDFDVAWIMQQGSDIESSNYNWSLFGVDGNSLTNRKTFNLSNFVDETQWHTYKIIWKADSTILIVDDVELFASTENLPDENMRVDLWIDNRVINLNNPFKFWNDNSEGSSMTVDYIEVSGIDGPAIPTILSGNILYWDSPNTYPNGKINYLWKEYKFSTQSKGEVLLFLTGSAENYGDVSEPDKLKIKLNDTDYQWDSNYALDGSKLKGNGKSIVLSTELNAGEHTFEIHSNITPYLRDVIIVHSYNGKTLFNREYNEIAEGEDGLWKTIEFDLESTKEVSFLVSGTGFNGDKIGIQIDNSDILWEGENVINGDELNGIPKTVVLNETLLPGAHTINIYKIGNPELYNISSYCTNIFYLNTKVFLEGSYKSNGMISNISTNTDFPKFQPFNIDPWNYNGSEEITDFPSGIIDWILIELKDDIFNPTKAHYRAALLNEKGNIIDLDGNIVKFKGVLSGQYYISIFHRNHLSIISNKPITVN